MPRATQSIQRLASQRLDAAAHASAASVDLQLDFVDERDGSLIGRFGGRWDRSLNDYVGDAPVSRKMRLHPGQLAAARWFEGWIDSWLSGEIADEDRCFDCVLSGGRRSGKSTFGFIAVVAFACAVPGSVVWVVTPSDAFFGEPIAYLRTIMPRGWYEDLGAPHWTFFLPNGSTIVLRSGHTPRRLKQGRCDLAFINEGQAVPTASYKTLSASIIDGGGLVLTAANPPDIGDPGEWVSDLVAGVESGELHFAEHFFFDPEVNPHIDQVALRAIREKMDPHTYDVQIRGKFLSPPDSVLHAWDRLTNEAPVPDIGRDITAAFTKHHEGRAFDDVVGVDVQNFPWIAAVRCRLYEDPAAPGIEDALLWVVGEAYVEKGDEVDCARELKELGCQPKRTLLITDASCRWQQQQRDSELQRPKYRGRGSMAIFEGEGYDHVVPPDVDMDANPHIVDRVRASNARIGAQSGARRVFADPRRAKLTCRSIRGWRRSKTTGQPSRHSIHAHGGDAITYVIWRFFPRRFVKDTVDVQAIKRFAGKQRLKGF